MKFWLVACWFTVRCSHCRLFETSRQPQHLTFGSQHGCGHQHKGRARTTALLHHHDNHDRQFDTEIWGSALPAIFYV